MKLQMADLPGGGGGELGATGTFGPAGFGDVGVVGTSPLLVVLPS